jgi:uncharacterized membrane protein HdeD (DUF308 family)
MSFNLSDSSKLNNQQITYNYYNIPLGSQEKNLSNNGYIKYGFSNSISTGFSNPNLEFGGNKYVVQNLSLFGHFYNIQNISYDGMLVLENKPITSNVASNLFTIFLLKTQPNMLANDIDSLWTNSPQSSLILNKFILSNQSCIVFDNVILFTSPISIHSNFFHFITPQYVSVGLLNSFTNDYTIGTAVYDPALSLTNKEGFTTNSIDSADFNGATTCTASDVYSGEDIVKNISLVPVDSDYLNGVYQITMLRTLFDIFIFILILLFSIFVSPPLYKYIVVDFVQKWKNPDYTSGQRSNDVITIVSFIDIFFSVLLIILGIVLAVNGANTSNINEMVIGIYFTIIVFFSICAIRYFKQKTGPDNWGFQKGIFDNFNITDGISNFIKFIKDLYDKGYLQYFLGLYLLFFIITIIIKFTIQQSTDWKLLLFCIIPISSSILAFVFTSIKVQNGL